MNPAQLNEAAPPKFQVKFETSKGEFTIEVTRAWAPKGLDLRVLTQRFEDLLLGLLIIALGVERLSR